jgi:phage shock protein C
VSRDRERRREPGGDGEREGEFQRAVDRLEKAVHGLVGTANEELSSRATRFVDEAAERLERELGHRNERRARGPQGSAHEEDDVNAFDGRSRRSRRRHRRARARSGLSSRDPGYRTSRLYRDRRRGRLGGVCAGLARYFGVEIWVVRVLAVTGVIFMSSIVIPAYFIAWVVVPPMPDADEMPVSSGASHNHSAVAPEFGSRLSPRRSLRDVQSGLDQLELKLRLMESHVTSGQYELQRELRKIDT